MKILVVCQHYPPEPFRLGDLCEALVERGHQVTVVTGTPNYPTGNPYPGYEHGARRVETVRGVEIHHCPIHLRKPGLLHRVWNYYSFVWSSCRVVDRLEDDFDVVYIHQLTPVMMAQAGIRWAKRHGKRCVLHCLDPWPESLLVGGIRKNSLIYKYFYYVSKNIYRKADRVLLSSNGFYSYFRDFIKIEEQKLGYLPQYAEDLFSIPNTFRPHQPPYHFMFAGNIGKLQSVETLIEAASLVQNDPRIHVDIVGDGISLEHCKWLASDLKNVTFYGRLPVQKMPELYQKADVMVVTLRKIPTLEGTVPGKVQSYMLSGKPILGACDGETARIVEEAGCGLCARAEDAQDLAAKMLSMVEEPERFAEYGQNALDYFYTYFSRDAFFERLCLELGEKREERISDEVPEGAYYRGSLR